MRGKKSEDREKMWVAVEREGGIIGGHSIGPELILKAITEKRPRRRPLRILTKIRTNPSEPNTPQTETYGGVFGKRWRRLCR